MKNSFIFRGIRVSLLKQSILPAVLCALSLWILSLLPLQSLLNPTQTGTLYDTGMDYKKSGRTAGHYYYSMEGGVCQFYLLKEQPPVQSASALFILADGGADYEALVSQTAFAIGWSTEDVARHAAPSILREASLFDGRALLLFSGAAFCALISVFRLLFNMLCLIRPPGFPKNRKSRPHRL